MDNILEEEDKIIVDRNGYKYIPEQVEKAMVADSEEGNQILKETREIYLNEIRYRYNINNYLYKDDDLYIISKEWYEKWKKYVKYKTVKKTCRTPEIYIKIKPITFTIKPELYPGPITNDDILIKKNEQTLINEKYPQLNNMKKNKKDYKFFPRVTYEILEKRYGNKNAIKVSYLENRAYHTKEYNKNSKDFSVLFIPKKATIGDSLIIKEYRVYLPDMLADDNIKTYFIDLLESPSNSEVKKELGINESSYKFMQFYRFIANDKYESFKKNFESDKEKFKMGEKMDVCEILKKIADRIQISQMLYHFLILEFKDENNESEYFKENIQKDVGFQNQENQ
jgi:hypothetical protein